MAWMPISAAGQPRVEPPVPVDVRAEADGHAVGDAPRRRRRGCRRPCGPGRSRRPSPCSRPRRGSAPGRRRAWPRRRAPARRRTGPWPPASSTTCETISMPAVSFRYERATAPSATRAAVSRALARSSTGRASSRSYFCMPARSAWPGRGRVSGALRASPARTSGSTGSAAMTCFPLGPLGVADHDRDGAAHGQAVPHAAEEGHLVLLELHPGAATVAEPPPRQRVRHHRGGDGHARRAVPPASRRVRGRATPPRSASAICSTVLPQTPVPVVASILPRSAGSPGPASHGAGRGSAAAGRAQRATSAASPAARIAASGAGARPVCCSTWRTAWCTSRSRPLVTRPPRALHAAASGVGQGS